MPSRNSSLYIIFAKTPPDPAERIADARERSWSAPKGAKPGDVALFYMGGLTRAICAVGRTETAAEPDEPDPEWTESRWGFFAQHGDIRTLGVPITLETIRRAFPTWGRWNNLRGVRVHIVPKEHRERLAKLIADANPSARSLRSPWLR